MENGPWRLRTWPDLMTTVLKLALMRVFVLFFLYQHPTRCIHLQKKTAEAEDKKCLSLLILYLHNKSIFIFLGKLDLCLELEAACPWET